MRAHRSTRPPMSSNRSRTLHTIKNADWKAGRLGEDAAGRGEGNDQKWT